MKKLDCGFTPSVISSVGPSGTLAPPPPLPSPSYHPRSIHGAFGTFYFSHHRAGDIYTNKGLR